MKKFLAASLAAFLLFTAAACTQQSSPQQTPEPAQPVTQEPAAQPEAPAQEPAEPIRITPNQQGSATPSDAVWLDEPDTIQTDLEEIVTCTYTLPHLTLDRTRPPPRPTRSLTRCRRPSSPTRRRPSIPPRRKSRPSATSTAATASAKWTERWSSTIRCPSPIPRRPRTSSSRTSIPSIFPPASF